MYELIEYNEKLENIWDKFIDESNQGTFLHSRRYLNYHKDRFVDKSLLVQSNNKTIAIFPCAVCNSNPNVIISHPGITYGGIIYNRNIGCENVENLIRLIFEFYFESGFNEIIYKATPFIYHNIPSQEDIYFLNRIGAINYRTDLSCSIDLSKQKSLSKQRLRSLKNANKFTFKLSNKLEDLEDCWKILEINLKEKYQTNPVHNIYEIRQLLKLFPNNINLIATKLNNEILASVILYKTKSVWHLQYISTSEEGRKTNALDFLINKILEKSVLNKIKWFDFGISTENEGEYLNKNLYNFKNGFGGGGTLCQFYRINKNNYLKNS